MKLRFIVPVCMIPLAALLTGCPDEEKKDTASPSASASASAVAVVDAAAPAEAGILTDAGKTDAAAPKK